MPITTLPPMAGKGRPPLNRKRFVASLTVDRLKKLDAYAKAKKVKRPDALADAVDLLPNLTPKPSPKPRRPGKPSA